MSRYSPTVLPRHADVGGALATGLAAFRASRAEHRQRGREDQLDAERLEDRRIAGEQRDRALEDRTRSHAFQDISLRQQGVVREDQADRVSRPDPATGAVVRGLDGVEARVLDPRYRPIAPGYVEDPRLTQEGRASAARDRLRGALVAAGEAPERAELRAVTGHTETAVDPRPWQPTSREEAVGLYRDTTGANARNDFSNRLALETRLHQNRLELVDREHDNRLEVEGMPRRAGTTTSRATTTKDPAFEERRRAIASSVGAPQTPLQQVILNQLAGGRTKTDVEAEIERQARARGLADEEIERHMAAARTYMRRYRER